MIMPSRWFAGGRGLDEFRENMLNDKHISILHDFLNPDQIFPNTNIRGGLCYFAWDKEYNNSENLTRVITHTNDGIISNVKRSLKTEGVDVFIRNNEATSIMNKVFRDKEKSFEEYISPLRPYGLRGYFAKDPNCKVTKEGMINPVGIYIKGQKLCYVEYDNIPTNKETIGDWKVYASRANNIGTELNDDNLNAFIGVPNTICTESFLVLTHKMANLDELNCKNICTYLRTRFARFMHSLAKSSQDATSKTWKFVPLQDFTSSSDIDWTQPVADIDQQLYKKYGLTQEETTFIERMIKPME